MSVAPKVGTVPTTELLLASFKVTVTVEVATLFATTGPEPVIDELTATAPPGSNTTVPSALLTGVAIERVFVSAVVEVRVQVETPRASVLLQVP